MYTKRILAVSVATLALIGAGCSSNKPAEPPKAAESAPPATPAAPPPADSAIAGEVRSIDPAGSSMTVRTADGKTHRVHVTPETKVDALHHGVAEGGRGAEAIARTTAQDIKKGTVVAIHYAEKEGKMVASHVKRGSKAVVKESEVVIRKVDQEGRKVYAKAKDGTEHVYEVGKEATIATGNKIADVGKVTGEKLKEGTQATIHFSEESGRKVMHFLKHQAP